MRKTSISNSIPPVSSPLGRTGSQNTVAGSAKPPTVGKTEVSANESKKSPQSRIESRLNTSRPDSTSTSTSLSSEDMQYFIYMFGYNQFSQLSTHILSPAIEEPTSINCTQKYIVDIKMGRFHTLLLTSYGKVIGLGKNTEFQRGSLQNGEYIPTNINPRHPNDELFIKSIECGGAHSILIDENHRVYAIGDNAEGQCGFPEDVASVPGLRRIAFPNNLQEEEIERRRVEKRKNEHQLLLDPIGLSYLEPFDSYEDPAIIEVFCGENTTFLLAHNQKDLYVMGQNDSGQLGFSQLDHANVYLPQKLPFLFEDCENPQNTTIVKVASGESHTLILLSDGTVLASGSNDDGAICGPSCSKFRPLTFFKQKQQTIVDISAGSRHSMFLADDGTVWMCGKNNYNQLGFHGKQRVEIPVRVMDGVQAIFAGSDFSLFRMRGEPDATNTVIMTTGRNKDGELGGQLLDQVFNTITVKGTARVISCGGYHTMILCGPMLQKQPHYISYPRHLRVLESLKSKQNIQLMGAQSDAKLQLEEYREKQTELQKEYEARIQLMNHENKTKLDELHQRHHDEKYALKLEYEEKIQAIKNEIQETKEVIENLKSTHSEDMKENYRNLLIEKKEMKNMLRSDMLDKEKEMSSNLQKAIKDENVRHEHEMGKLHKQYETAEQILERRLSDQDRQIVTNSYRQQYQVELKEKKRLLDEEYQKQLRKMQKRLDEEYRKNILWLVTMKKQFELARNETNIHSSNKTSEEKIDSAIVNRHEERINRLQKRHEEELDFVKRKAQKLLAQHGIVDDLEKKETETETEIAPKTPRRFIIPKLLTPGTPKVDFPLFPSSPKLLPRANLPDRLIGKFVKEPQYKKGDFVEKLHEGSLFNGTLDISMKVMHWSQKEMENMERQVYRLIQLHHPYIRKCYGLDFSGDDAIVLCERCDMNVMTKVLENGLSLKERVTLSLQVLEGSNFLLESKMHANLKMESILIGRDGSIRIDVIGTAYQQPEIRSLIYAFGFFLYQMVTLRTIITNDPETNEVSIPENCPKDIGGIILACMHPDETERPTDIQSICEVLSEACDKISEETDSPSEPSDSQDPAPENS